MDTFSVADEQLANLLKNSKRSLVVWDKFGSQGRNFYSGPKPLTSMRPYLSICEYPTWGEIQPNIVLARESFVPGRLPNSPSMEDFLFAQIHEILQTTITAPAIMTWYETPKKREIAQQYNGLVLTIPQHVRELVEDKTRLPKIIKSAKVNTNNQLRMLVYPKVSTLPGYYELANKLGKTFVIQGRSMGGNGTAIVSDPYDLDRALPLLSGQIRVTEFCNQQYSTVCLLTIPVGSNDCQVYVCIPSHKATSIPELGITNVEGAGGDYSLPYPSFATTQFIEDTYRIGKHLYNEYGLIGHWQIEGFMTEKAFLFNEINGRPGGGTLASSINQMMRGYPAFWVSHVILFMGGSINFMPGALDYNHETISEIRKPTSLRPFYLKCKVTGNKAIRLRSGCKGNGVYKIKDRELTWIRPGQSTLDANFENDEVLIANLPLGESICYPGKSIASLEGMNCNRHVFAGPNSLSNHGHMLATAIKGLFEPVDF